VVTCGVGLVAGPGKLGLGHVVERDHVPAAGPEDLAYVGPKEPTASCDQNFHAT
jgi:hypothetical protein